MTDDSRISKPTKGQIEVIARAIIIDDKKILLCQPVGKDYYFLPGGHVEHGEYSADTLKREIVEELGVKAAAVKQVGIVENIYDDSDFKLRRHEFNVLFEAKLASRELKLSEEHIDIEWKDLASFDQFKVLPAGIKEYISRSYLTK